MHKIHIIIYLYIYMFICIILNTFCNLWNDYTRSIATQLTSISNSATTDSAFRAGCTPYPSIADTIFFFRSTPSFRALVCAMGISSFSCIRTRRYGLTRCLSKVINFRGWMSKQRVSSPYIYYIRSPYTLARKYRAIYYRYPSLMKIRYKLRERVCFIDGSSYNYGHIAAPHNAPATRYPQHV